MPGAEAYRQKAASSRAAGISSRASQASPIQDELQGGIAVDWAAYTRDWIWKEVFCNMKEMLVQSIDMRGGVNIPINVRGSGKSKMCHLLAKCSVETAPVESLSARWRTNLQPRAEETGNWEVINALVKIANIWRRLGHGGGRPVARAKNIIKKRSTAGRASPRCEGPALRVKLVANPKSKLGRKPDESFGIAATWRRRKGRRLSKILHKAGIGIYSTNGNASGWQFLHACSQVCPPVELSLF